MSNPLAQVYSRFRAITPRQRFRAAVFATIAVNRLLLPLRSTDSAFNVSGRETADERIVQAALEEGAERLDTVRLMVLGGPTRGKTSTIASLRREEFDPCQDSTRGVDLSVYYLVLGKFCADKDLERALSAKNKFEARFRAYSKKKYLEGLGTLWRGTPLAEFRYADLDEISTTATNGVDSYSSLPKPELTHPNVVELLAKDAETVQTLSTPKVDGLTLRCWDFGGQREYEVAHEMFISPRAILMLVFDLTRFENESTRDEEVRELSHWLQTVFALIPEKYLSGTASSLLIVGTRRNSCNHPDRVSGYLKQLRDCLLDSLDAGVTQRLGLASVAIFAIENRTAVACPESSGLAALEKHLDTVSRRVIHESEKVPLRWLAFLQSLRDELRQEEFPDLFINHDFIEARMKGFFFPPSGIGRMTELRALLLYFRDVGELVLYDRSPHQSTGGRPDYVVCMQPESVLRALKVIIAPESVRCEGLTDRKDRKKMREGLLTASMLKQKWKNMDGLADETQRRTLVELFASMDLFVELGSDLFGVPSLLPSGWEDWGWISAGEDKSEVAAVTLFDNYVPFGLIGTLISRLHRTIGERRTDVHYVRSNAVLLTIGMRPADASMTQVFTGFDKSRRELHWKVRSEAHDFQVLYRCLAEFNAHMRARINSTLCESRHFLVADCPRGCAKMGFRLMFPVPPNRVRQESKARIRFNFLLKIGFRPLRSLTRTGVTVAGVSRRCDKALCSNSNCRCPYTYEQAMRASEVSATPGTLRQGEPDPYVVFVSHAGAHQDKKWAEYLAKALESREPSLRTFVDRPELTGSWETSPEIMEKAMQSARVGVFITSPEHFGRKWTMRELRTFLDRNVTGRATGERIVIYPIFHRLSFKEASDPHIYKNPKFSRTIVDAGFFDPGRQTECSTTQAIEAMRQLCKFPGLEKKLPALHEWSRSRDSKRYLGLRFRRKACDVDDPDKELGGVTLEEFFEFAALRIANAYDETRQTG